MRCSAIWGRRTLHQSLWAFIVRPVTHHRASKIGQSGPTKLSRPKTSQPSGGSKVRTPSGATRSVWGHTEPSAKWTSSSTTQNRLKTSGGRPVSQKPSGATQRQQKAVWLRYEKSGQQQIVDEVFIRIYNSDHRWQISVSQNTSFCTRHLHVVWLRMASARRPDGSWRCPDGF